MRIFDRSSTICWRLFFSHWITLTPLLKISNHTTYTIYKETRRKIFCNNIPEIPWPNQSCYRWIPSCSFLDRANRQRVTLTGPKLWCQNSWVVWRLESANMQWKFLELNEVNCFFSWPCPSPFNFQFQNLRKVIPYFSFVKLTPFILYKSKTYGFQHYGYVKRPALGNQLIYTYITYI